MLGKFLRFGIRLLEFQFPILVFINYGNEQLKNVINPHLR